MKTIITCCCFVFLSACGYESACDSDQICYGKKFNKEMINLWINSLSQELEDTVGKEIDINQVLTDNPLDLRFVSTKDIGKYYYEIDRIILNNKLTCDTVPNVNEVFLHEFVHYLEWHVLDRSIKQMNMHESWLFNNDQSGVKGRTIQKYSSETICIKE